MKICPFQLENSLSAIEIPLITQEESLDIIKKMKPTDSAGLDDINSRFIKLIPKTVSLKMTHLINTIIRSKMYPKILKISKVLPILKQGKSPTEPSSYRPISNLSVFDKIIHHIVKYLEDNKIVLPNHHGGREGFSTLSAKNHIDYLIGKGVERKRTTVMLNTDMSAFFNTVNHSILIGKRRFYGFGKDTLALMASFLTDRSQYIELEGKNGEPLPNPDCGTLQGSKLSGILALLYINEVPLIHNLLKDKELTRYMTGTTITIDKEIEHETINFVDDSGSIITFENEENSKIYLQTFIQTLETFYNINKLCIDSEKTALLVFKSDNEDNYIIKTKDDKI